MRVWFWTPMEQKMVARGPSLLTPLSRLIRTEVFGSGEKANAKEGAGQCEGGSEESSEGR